MSFVISQGCIGTKATECEKVCPVDCIHPREDEVGFDEVEQLYIDPRLCINCGACMAVCPVYAVYPEEEIPGPLQFFVEKNIDHFRMDLDEFHNQYPQGESKRLIKEFVQKHKDSSSNGTDPAA